MSVQWSVTTDSELFNVSGNHVNEGDHVEEDIEIDIDKVSTFAPSHPLNSHRVSGHALTASRPRYGWSCRQ